MNFKTQYRKNKRIYNNIIFILCIIAIIAGILCLGMNKNKQSNKTIKHEFEDEQVKEMNEGGVIPGIEMPGFSEITINSDSTDAKVDFFNPENNNVYFQIQLLLNDTGEVFYESKLLKPGQHIYDIKLNKKFQAGLYNMTIVYNTFSMDEEYTPKNGASIDCVLKVV